MILTNKLLPIALIAALVGGSVGAFVMHKSQPTAAETVAQSNALPATQASDTEALPAEFKTPAEQTAYTSSKFAVRGFTESLRHELSDTNVAVSCVHPGGIKTNIVRNSKVGKETPAEWKQQGEKFFDKVAKTSPEEAAEVIVHGIKNRNPRILIGKDAIGISILSRLFPKRNVRIIERLAGHKMSLRKK